MMANKNIDILKYILSIFIIMIHLGWTYNYMVFTRMAVPIFFIISSYLFFKKVNNSPENSKHIYQKFLRRSVGLYIFWFILLLPLTYSIRGWETLDYKNLLNTIILSITIKSSFPASWYISAYIIGISLTYWLRKHDKFILLIGIIGYIVCCLMSNYIFLLDYISNGYAIREYFMKYSIYNSFPVGLIFIYLGKILSTRTVHKIQYYLIGTIIGIILLYIENTIICKFGIPEHNDCFMSNCLLSPCMFMLILSLPQFKYISNSQWLRNLSTIYYCSHLSIIIVIRQLYPGFSGLIYLTTTIALCTFMGMILIYMSRLNNFSILKYSY